MRLISKNKIFSAYVAVPALGIMALAVASCSSKDDTDIVPSTNAIVFTATAPYAQQSRAVTTTGSLESFTVFGFVNNQIYMNDVKVNKVDNRWTYSPVQYWPLEESVNFYSYSPEKIVTQNPVNNMDGRKADIPGFINDGSTDLLYGVNMDLSAATSKQVKVNFRHALSQVRFMLKRRSGEKINIHVSEMTLVGTNSIGSFTFPRETTSADNTVTGTWYGQNGVTDYPIFTGYETIDDDEKEELTNTGFMFAVPQYLAEADGSDYTRGAYLRIRCNMTDSGTGMLVWPSSTAEGYDNLHKTAYVYFPLATSTSTYKQWEPGKAYMYTVMMGVPGGQGAIDFDITVDTYPEFAKVDVD